MSCGGGENKNLIIRLDKSIERSHRSDDKLIDRRYRHSSAKFSPITKERTGQVGGSGTPSDPRLQNDSWMAVVVYFRMQFNKRTEGH